MLLVNDTQSQISKQYVILYERVRANQDVDFSRA